MGWFSKNTKNTLTKEEIKDAQARKAQAEIDNQKSWKSSKKDIGGVAYEMNHKGATGKIINLTDEEYNTHRF